MLALWLSKFLFEENLNYCVDRRVLPLAVALASGRHFPLAPLFLGQFYRMMDYIVEDELESCGRWGIYMLINTNFLQIFICERFEDV